VHCKQRHGLALRSVLLSASVRASASSVSADTSSAASAPCPSTLVAAPPVLWQRFALCCCSWVDALRGRSYPPPSSQRVMPMRRSLNEGLYGPGMLLGCGVGLGCGCCAPAEVEPPRAGAAAGGGAAGGAAAAAGIRRRRPLLTRDAQLISI
jgi:hypothetical protein